MAIITKYKPTFKNFLSGITIMTIPAGNYMLKVNNTNTRTRCEIYSKSTIKTREQCHWHHCGVFIVNFEHISHSFSSVFIVNFEQLNTDWDFMFGLIS